MESRFKLIEGKFSVDEAREIIGNLFDYKIQFHNKQSFRSEIKTGREDERSLVRTENLKKTKIEFLSYLKTLPNEAIIEVFSEINIAK